MAQNLESLSLKRGPAGMWHDTVSAEMGGAVMASLTAMAYYMNAARRGDPNPSEQIWPGIKMGLLVGSVPYVAGAMVGSMSGYPSTKHMNELEQRDWPSWLIPGRAGYRSGKRVRYLLEVAKRNQRAMANLNKPVESDMPTAEAMLRPMTEGSIVPDNSPVPSFRQGSMKKAAAGEQGYFEQLGSDYGSDINDAFRSAGPALSKALPAVAVSAVAAGMLSSLAMLAKLKAVKNQKGMLTKADLKAIGAPPNIPQKIIKGYDNARYFEPPYSPSIPFIGAEKEKGESARAYANRLKYGRIVYGDKFKKPGIMMHEAGHSAIYNLPAYHPAHVMQTYLRNPVVHFLARAASVVGGATAGVLISRKTDNPLLGAVGGAAVGGGLGLLTDAPTLWSEYGASARAADRLDKAKMTQAQRDENKRLLRRAWMTYATSAAALPLFAGVAAPVAEALR